MLFEFTDRAFLNVPGSDGDTNLARYHGTQQDQLGPLILCGAEIAKLMEMQFVTSQLALVVQTLHTDSTDIPNHITFLPRDQEVL